MQYWQVASGNEDRDYHQEFLDFGIAFSGNTAMSKISEGDRIVLRRRSKVVAAGIAKKPESQESLSGSEGKEWLRDFDGWDLPSYFWVEWYLPDSEPKFKAGYQTSFSRANDSNVRKIADEILKSGTKWESSYEDPPLSREVKDTEIENHLRVTLDAERAPNPMEAIQEIRDLARHYYHDYGYGKWKDVKEHEIRTFLIIPLLISLGWDQKNIKIEITPKKLGSKSSTSKSIDIALLAEQYDPENLDENGTNCTAILESKTLRSGIGNGAFAQVEGYAKNLPNCKAVFVSNGYCYKAYVKEDDGTFSKAPKAYINLLKPREKHPIKHEIDGTLKMLDLLSPKN